MERIGWFSSYGQSNRKTKNYRITSFGTGLLISIYQSAFWDDYSSVLIFLLKNIWWSFWLLVYKLIEGFCERSIECFCNFDVSVNLGGEFCTSSILYFTRDEKDLREVVARSLVLVNRVQIFWSCSIRCRIDEKVYYGTCSLISDCRQNFADNFPNVPSNVFVN